MSKRTTSESKTPAPTAPRRRTTKPAVDTTAAEAPKAPRTRRKADVTVSAETTAPAPVRRPSHDDIAIRAYFIAIEQGADPVAAWLLAERELTTA